MPCDRNQVTDAVQAVFFRQSLRYTDGIGVIETQLIQQRHTIVLSGNLIDILIDRHSRRYIVYILPEEGGQQGTIIGDHKVAGVIATDHGFEIIHLRHLVTDAD